jgi:hypothetical protein
MYRLILIGGYYGAQLQETEASAIVYPFGDFELNYLLTNTCVSLTNTQNSDDTDDNEDSSHSSCRSSGGRNKNRYRPTPSSCGIPFYHMSGGNWPGGRAHRFQESHQANKYGSDSDDDIESRVEESRVEDFNDNALFICVLSLSNYAIYQRYCNHLYHHICDY